MAATQFHHDESLLDLIDRVGDLKFLPRTGWLLAGVTGAESVADHSCGVALIALFLAETINADWTAQGIDEPLRVDQVMALALIHDLAESLLTDLPRRSSSLLGESVKHSVETQAMHEILDHLPNGAYYHNLWQSYNTASTPEARLIKDVDKLEMAAQALRYAQRGHRNLQEFWQGRHWHYPISQSLFEQLLRRHLPDAL
ncbi:MAG: HD family hydrolase [Caldilineaceae bacterium]|nr:HD family hydrolase [Caldilineaceae bacterium]